ncbi:MAG: GTP cyclohydrolase 1 type 2 [Chlamydiales bacterium]|nr:GTP cyclohydrolase 1 type 2 [Chlamydiales bacterium]
MMQRDEFEKALNDYLRKDFIQDYCPNGLQVEGKDQIKKVVTAVSANLMTIEQAIECGADALVVHHGIFWNSDSYPIVGAKRKKLELLLKHQLSVFAYHLPLDAHQEVGNNWTAARQLGWKNLKPFGLLNGTEIGVRGEFSARPIQMLIAELETYYAHSASVALGGKEIVQSAALISGGAYKELFSAAQAGVDCFITGNFDEPAWGVAHEEQIHFLALGHSATEKVGPKALADHIHRLGLDCSFLDVFNPF